MSHPIGNSRRVTGITAALAAVTLASAGHAGTFTLPATDSGWHSSAGNHTASNRNYAVGWDDGELRNFFVFDLSGVPAGETVVSATLRLYSPAAGEGGPTLGGGYDSPDASETYQLHEVLLPAAVVTAPTIANPLVFTDLGDGTVYGSRAVGTADDGTFVEVPLNASGVAAVDAAGGSFVIGGRVTTLAATSGVAEILFAHTDPVGGPGPYPRELVVVTTPAGAGDCGNGILEGGEACDEGARNGTTASCCASDCTFTGRGESCDDGDACTRTDACDGAGSCAGSDPVECTASDACHAAGTCDPATGLCDDPAKRDGTACEDGEFCTVDDACEGGVCIAGADRDCSAEGDQCHDAVCDETHDECVAVPRDDDTDGDGTADCLDVDIDIAPGDSRNFVNPKSKGAIAVAILSNASYDALRDRPFVGCFGRTPTEGPAAPCDATEKHGMEHLADVDGDGDLDTVLHYDVPETGIEPGDTAACLEGTVGRARRAIRGCDRVTTPRR